MISQRLIPCVDENHSVPALEILIGNGRVRKAIEEKNVSSDLKKIIEESQDEVWNMLSFEKSLIELTEKGAIDMQTALLSASSPEKLKLAFEGISLMEQPASKDSSKVRKSMAHLRQKIKETDLELDVSEKTAKKYKLDLFKSKKAGY